jgi:zinc-ribbon domain
MGLVRCRECGEKVSTRAPVCPHCGVHRKSAGSEEGNAAKIVIGIIAGIGLGIIVLFFLFKL